MYTLKLRVKIFEITTVGTGAPRAANGPGAIFWWAPYLLQSLNQGCPTFLFNGPHCKLKYVTGPQNQQNSSKQWKNTWIAIRSVFS